PPSSLVGEPTAGSLRRGRRREILAEPCPALAIREGGSYKHPGRRSRNRAGPLLGGPDQPRRSSMRSRIWIIGGLWAVSVVASGAALAADEHAGHAMAGVPGEGKTQLFDTYGKWHRAITTQSGDAQKYFDQGLRQLYGFEMQGAERSFRKA